MELFLNFFNSYRSQKAANKRNFLSFITDNTVFICTLGGLVHTLGRVYKWHVYGITSFFIFDQTKIMASTLWFLGIFLFFNVHLHIFTISVRSFDGSIG